ncbi:MAG: branched-chain amino acid aminotransferase [Clostridia bacterium]|nr:branched-chain amino acid aminotransferase [Clostridia bacterium]
MEISVTLNTNPKAKPQDETALGFGKIFTDHMFLMNYNPQQGWHDARIVPFGDISLSPASTVLHYGAEIFEGMKAYRRADGEIQFFRPQENFKRMNNSADRMCLPKLDEEFCLKALKKLVSIDKDWVPHTKGASLYIRPFLFGNDPFLGVHTVSNCIFCIILSPSGAYYKEGINPVRIMIETQDVRAVRGGTGYAKCGGNYAASMRAGEKAEQQGYAQVLWLDGVERKYVEEVGSMNVMFKISGTVVTPKLTGSVLPGVTRKSCIALLKDWGVPVEERLISVEELAKAVKEGTLEEAWGTGTAAVVSPMGELNVDGVSYVVNGGKIGALTQKLYDELTGIQWGLKPDKFGWIEPLN